MNLQHEGERLVQAAKCFGLRVRRTGHEHWHITAPADHPDQRPVLLGCSPSKANPLREARSRLRRWGVPV